MMWINILKGFAETIFSVKVSYALYDWCHGLVKIPLDASDITNIDAGYYTYNAGLGYYQMTLMQALQYAIAEGLDLQAEDTVDLGDDWEEPTQVVVRIPFGPAFDLTGAVSTLQQLLDFLYSILAGLPFQDALDAIKDFNFTIPGSTSWQYWDYVNQELKVGSSFSPAKSMDFDDLIYLIALIRFVRFLAKHLKQIGRFGSKIVAALYKFVLGILKAPAKYLSSRMKTSRLVEKISSSTNDELDDELSAIEEDLTYVANKFRGAYSPQKGSVYF